MAASKSSKNVKKRPQGTPQGTPEGNDSSTGLSSSMSFGGASKSALLLVILCLLSSGVEGFNQTQKWAFVTGGVVLSSPALSSDGATVFVGSHDKNLYAIDAASGVMDSGDVLTTSDACVNETRTMKEIISGGREASGGFFQGGLGGNAQDDWKTYGCWRKHACLDALNAAGIDTTGDAICYKFNSAQHSWLLPPIPLPSFLLNLPNSDFTSLHTRLLWGLQSSLNLQCSSD